MSNKVVYNACYGGFGLSDAGKERYTELTGCDANFYDWHLCRHDPALVQVVEELGDAASGLYSHLQVADIESSMYRIDDYDGNESVETPRDIEWVQI